MAGARGESQLVVKGQTYNLLYTNRALIEAEQATQKGIMQLFREVRDDSMHVQDLVTLLRVGLEAARRDGKAGGRPYSQIDAIQIQDQAGFAPVMAAVWAGIGNVLAYDSTEGPTEGADETRP
jgi:hypothetical protein